MRYPKDPNRTEYYSSSEEDSIYRSEMLMSVVRRIRDGASAEEAVGILTPRDLKAYSKGGQQEALFPIELKEILEELKTLTKDEESKLSIRGELAKATRLLGFDNLARETASASVTADRPR